jgi:hypothetical protein
MSILVMGSYCMNSRYGVLERSFSLIARFFASVKANYDDSQEPLNWVLFVRNNRLFVRSLETRSQAAWERLDLPHPRF